MRDVWKIALGIALGLALFSVAAYGVDAYLDHRAEQAAQEEYERELVDQAEREAAQVEAERIRQEQAAEARAEYEAELEERYRAWREDNRRRPDPATERSIACSRGERSDC